MSINMTYTETPTPIVTDTIKVSLHEALKSGLILKTWFDNGKQHVMNSIEDDLNTFNCTIQGPYSTVSLADTVATRRFIKTHNLTVLN